MSAMHHLLPKRKRAKWGHIQSVPPGLATIFLPTDDFIVAIEYKYVLKGVVMQIQLFLLTGFLFGYEKGNRQK